MLNILAIVIPYHKISFFKETLESIANQTNKNFKVYIGDDASPENPIELLREYTVSFDFVYQRFEKNLGGISLTKQWERCLEMIEDEEWFMILGDDDVLSENVVSSFYENLEQIKQSKSKVVRFNYLQIDSSGVATSPIYKTDKLVDPTWNITEKLKNKIYTSLSQYVFHKRAFDRFGFDDLPLAWGSDDLAVLKVSDGKPIYRIDKEVLVRFSDLNISGNRNLIEQKKMALQKFYIALLNSKLFTRKDCDFISDLYFNIVLEKKSSWDKIVFFRTVLFKVSGKQMFYFVKAYVAKLVGKN